MATRNMQYSGIVLGMLFFLLSSTSFAVQGPRKIEKFLLVEANQAMSTAKSENADILAPAAFQKAMEAAKKAESAFLRGKKLSEVRKHLRTAITAFYEAVDRSRVARVTFGLTLQARFDASKAEAPDVVPEIWKQAETKLKEAAQTLERGFVKDAQKMSGEAEKMYRKAEIQTIRQNYIGQAYDLLKEAERLQVKLYAPKTLKKAQDLVKEAEKELAENRDDTDVARVLARQARRAARHAIYLATTIRLAKEKTLTWEDVLLASEVPLKRIAQAMDIDIAFEEGFAKTTERIVGSITEYKKLNRKLSTDVFDAGQRISLLQARNEELETKLVGVEKEKSVFVQSLEAQEKIRQKYDAVENLFSSDEALIFREGNDIRIRLTGLNFPSGKSTIDPKYYSFLGKVLKAIRMFPEASVTVEGHTDAFGSDEMNLKLSYDRAENVMLYILENTDVDKSFVKAVGYGESKPIATNETEEGRAKNRRIAVVIHPNLEEGF